MYLISDMKIFVSITPLDDINVSNNCNTTCAGIGPLSLDVVLVIILLETVFFTFKQIEKEKYKIKNLAVKKVSSVFTQYVCLCICVYVCLCVCLSVGALQTPSFNIGDWNLKMVYFTFFKFCLFLKFFPFFVFPIFFILKLLVNLS